MKKKKNQGAILALCLIVALLAPVSTLFACGESANSSTQSGAADLTNSSNSTSQPLPEDSSTEEAPPSSVAPESSAPDANEPPAQPVVKKTQYIRCTADSVNLRTGAGTSFSVLGQAEEGTMYAVIGKTGNWYKTYY